MIAFLLPCIACAQATAAASSTSVNYTVSLANRSQHLVRISMGVSGGSSLQDVQLPVWNAVYQVRDFAQYVNWVRAKNSSGQMEPVHKVDKTTWRATPATTEIEYEIFADNPGPFDAQLNEHHAFFNLAQILMYPVNGRGSPMTIRFTDIPSGWRIANALSQSADGGFAADNYDRLVDAPFEIGAFQEKDFEQSGGHYRVVVDADPADYDLEKLVNTDRNITAAETSWMNDRPFETYLFIYHFPRGPGAGGMEHANCTAIDINARRLSQNPKYLMGVSAHEFFHLWNVKRIRPQSLEPIDYTRENYTKALWFSEGVTTTGADYALLHAGVLDPALFRKELAAQILELEQSPAHATQSVEESSLDTWFDKYDYYVLPGRSISYYTKGFLLGILLDLQMRQDSHGQASLRDLFQSMNQTYPRQGRFFPDSDGVRQAAETLTHSDLGGFFQKYVSGTAEIPWDDFFQTVGLHLARTMNKAADPGFSVLRTFNALPTVGEVAANSEAAHAGLTAGDLVLEINGKTATPDLKPDLERIHAGDMLTLRVRNSKREHELRWKVGSREQLEFELKDIENVSAEQKARRAAWLRGESQPSGDAHP